MLELHAVYIIWSYSARHTQVMATSLAHGGARTSLYEDNILWTNLFICLNSEQTLLYYVCIDSKRQVVLVCGRDYENQLYIYYKCDIDT